MQAIRSPARASQTRRWVLWTCLLASLLFVSASAAPEDPILVLPRFTPDQVRPVLSPDGSLLAVSGTMGSVMVFDANSGGLVKVLTGLSGGWRAVTFTHNGQYLLGVSESGGLRARVWRTSNWSLYREITAQLPHWLRAVAISPDARWLAVGGWNYLQIYNLDTGEKVTDLPQPGRYVYGLDFSPDGQYLASANENTKAVLWRVSDWQQERVLAEELSDTIDLKFSPDGNYLALSSGETLRVWQTTNWDAPLYTKSLGPFSSSYSRHVPLAFSPDSQRLVVRSGSTSWEVSIVKVYRTGDGTELASVSLGDSQHQVSYVYGLALRDNDLFAGVGGTSPVSSYRIVQVNVATGATVRHLEPGVRAEVYRLQLSADGSRLAYCYGYHDGVRVIDPSTGAEQMSLEQRSFDVALSPDGSRLFVTNRGTMYSVPDGTPLWSIGGEDMALFFPDGRRLIVKGDGTYSSDSYYLYDAITGTKIRDFQHAGTAGVHLCLTPDGKYLMVPARGIGWNWDDQFRVWRVDTGQLVFDQTWYAKSVDISPSGNTLVAVSGGQVYINQVTDLGETLQFTNIRNWQAHGDVINRVRFAPNGMALVSAGEDAAVKVWRVMDAGLHYNLKGHLEAVYDVAVAQSRSDLLVAAAGWGGIAVWRLPMPGTGNTPVSVPQVIYPMPNAEIDDWVLRFQATDPDADDRLRFRVEIFAADGSLVRQFDQTVDATPFDKPFAASEEVVMVNLDADLAPGMYRFRVRATDGWSWSDWSEERPFVLVKPVLPLGQLRTLRMAGGRWRATFRIPEGATKLFFTSRSVEQGVGQTVRLFKDGSQLVEQNGPDVLIDRSNPAAGEYEVEIVPSGAAHLTIYVGTELPTVRLGARYNGTIYRNDGSDWLQMDVPEGVRSIELVVDAPGNVTDVTVWRGYIGSWQRWSASQRFNPPVRLTINNPPAGRYYLQITDHGRLAQTQVRQYVLSLSGPQATVNASVSPTMASAGSPDPVTFTVRYANEGSAPLASAVLKAVLPEGLNLVEGSISEGGTYDTDTRTVQWNLSNLAAGASGTASFQAQVASNAPNGTNLSVQVSLESTELAETVSQQVALWVGAAGITFDNVYTAFHYVNATIGGLSIDRTQGTPRVWLQFPAGTAVSTEVEAEEVTVSEDGTQVTARFGLMDKVLQDVAPTLHLSHPSVGTQQWQAPLLRVFDIGADVQYNKPFLRMGRRETMHLRVTNPNATWMTPFVKVQMTLDNVPPDETITVAYTVKSPDGSQTLAQGSVTTVTGEFSVLLPPVAPGATVEFPFEFRVTSSRAAQTRLAPLAFAAVFVASEVAIFASWAGHRLLKAGCERMVKRRLLEDFAMAGYDLDDRQIDNLYRAYRQAGDFASAWMSELLSSGIETLTVEGAKRLITRKYGEQFATAAEVAYKVAKGEHPFEILWGQIASAIVPDIAMLPATTAVKAFLAEGQNCIKQSQELRRFAQRFNKENRPGPPGGLRVTRAWDPNAKSGTFGVEGYIPGGQAIDYTVYFENDPLKASAAAEEVLIEDILDPNLDDSTLVFTGVGVGTNQVTLPAPVSRLSQGIDLGNNLVVRVESSYDPATRKLTVRFRGIDTRTGDIHENGFLPPNNNEPEGEGYVSFRIQPKADVPSGTRIVNKAIILFDPHLLKEDGTPLNPPMETNEHALTLDKEAPQVAIADLPAQQPKPTFTLSWQGNDDASGVKQAEIWYSTDGRAFQLWRALPPAEGQQTGSAPFQGKFGYTYRFYVVGEDKVGNRSTVPAEPHAVVTAGVAPQVPAGLRLIALPVISETADAKGVLNFDADKLAAYVPGTGYARYPNAALQLGRGYWVQLPNAQRPSIRGDIADETQPYRIALQQGWNLIGNPWLENLAWNLNAIQVEVGGQTKSLAEAQAAGWVEDYAWGWDGTKYVLVYDSSAIPGVSNQLQAWHGYWVYAHQACNLILPSPSAGRASVTRRAEGERRGWSFPVRLQFAGESAEVTVGVSSGTRGLSVGLPPEPPVEQGKRVKLSIVQSGQPYVVDVRRSAGKQVWELQAEWNPMPEATEPVTLTVGNVASVPRGTALWLVDRTTGKRYYLRTMASYRFTPSEGERSRQFQLVAEPETGVGLKIVGVNVTRTRGGAFSVAFQLTSPAAVTAEVLNASGKPVARLNPFGGRAVEGMQSLTWRGIDDNGIALPAGAYLLRLQATDEEGRQTRVNVPLVLTR